MVTTSKRFSIGLLFYRYRGWSLVPLLAIGLLVNTRFLPANSGNFMMVLGAIGILFGSLLRIVCSTFISHKEMHDPLHVKQLIVDGPYAISRNPGYLGEGAIALGIAMMSRMPWFILTTLVAGLIIVAVVIDWEEKMLSMRFGKIYDNYCRTVPRWFSWGRLVHPDSYLKTKGRIKFLTAIRAESGTLLIALLSILAFIAKADLEIYLFEHIFP
ncbi:MAG: methyltransferase family protein [Calditrichota bacterium]